MGSTSNGGFIWIVNRKVTSETLRMVTGCSWTSFSKSGSCENSNARVSLEKFISGMATDADA